MSVPRSYLFQQGPALRTLAHTAAGVIRQSFGPKFVPTPPATPGAVIEETIPPRPAELIRDFVKTVGGRPGAWGDAVPPAFFCQWALPYSAKTLSGLRYPFARALNAGCRLTRNAPLPAGEPLQIRAWLDRVDDDGYRAVFYSRVVTGTASAPDALDAELRAIVPLKKKEGGVKEEPMVPAGAREIAYRVLGPDAGLEFALLTGDFNPIHWLAPYARMSGFKNVILHGFGTFARAYEALARNHAGSVLKSIDVRFTRPVVLPRAIGVFTDDADGVYVGDGPGSKMYMSGVLTLERYS